MYVKPDALAAAAAAVEREWGSGYGIEAVHAIGYTGGVRLEVVASDGSRFQVAADRWGNVWQPDRYTALVRIGGRVSLVGLTDDAADPGVGVLLARAEDYGHVIAIRRPSGEALELEAPDAAEREGFHRRVEMARIGY